MEKRKSIVLVLVVPRIFFVKDAGSTRRIFGKVRSVIGPPHRDHSSAVVTTLTGEPTEERDGILQSKRN